MAAKAGLNDPGTAKRLFEFTDGHPLLLSMWIEEELDREGPDGNAHLDEPSAQADEAERTRWIYDRIVHRFSDSTARKVAANLSLLEWFDLGLLRSVFDPAFSEEAFEQMVNRSFIKPLGKKRWRCHDMVRKHLPAHRRSVDPEECAEVCRRAAEAFLKRLTQEEERLTIPFPTVAFSSGKLFKHAGFSLAESGPFIQQEPRKGRRCRAADYRLRSRGI